MKKYILIIFILFTSNSIFAQIDKIVGNWSEIMRIRIDTTSSGREEMEKDWEAVERDINNLTLTKPMKALSFPVNLIN
jgi:hypothetical protein